MDTLGALFGSTARVKILRLFLSNSLEIFSVDDVAQKSKVKGVEVRKEISLLKKIGFLSEKTCIKEVLVKKGTKEMIVKKRVTGLQFKQDFSLLAPLKNLIFSEMPLNRNEIIKRFRSVGKIDVGVMAQALGGGGHYHSRGLRQRCPQRHGLPPNGRLRGRDL